VYAAYGLVWVQHGFQPICRANNREICEILHVRINKNKMKSYLHRLISCGLKITVYPNKKLAHYNDLKRTWVMATKHVTKIKELYH